MKCIILNKNYPPNSGITGYSASLLARYLVDRGVDVTVVTTDAEYGGVKESANLGGVTVIAVRAIYQGKNKYLRLIASLYEGYQLTKQASKLKAATWICMTDPPLLNLWVGFMAKKLKLPWAYWTMDLYPDAFYAAGFAKKSNYVYRILIYFIKKNQPDFIISLGSQQANYLTKEYGYSSPIVLLPCGVSKNKKDESPPKWANGNYEILFGYAGNIGEAHNADFLIEVIRKIDYKKNRFVLSLYGSHANFVINEVKGIEGLIIVETIAQSQLRFIDIHLASLIPKWDHICVPSKAVTSICQGGALLYFGSENNDNWRLLGDCGWRIDPDYDLERQVVLFLDNLNIDELATKKKLCGLKAIDLEEIEMNAYKEIYRLLSDLEASDGFKIR